jgi:hypothetical protein
MSTVMTNQDSQETRQRQWMALLCAALALLATLAPWMARTAPVERVGVLRWSDLQTSGALRPAGVAADAPVEWVVAMPAR